MTTETNISTSTELVDVSKMSSLKTVGLISYVLHLIVALGAVIPGAQASVLLLLVAFVLDLVKKEDAKGTWLESHFDWRIKSVLWMGGLYIITLPLWLLFIAPGWIAWVIISLWFLYRIVKGLMRHSDSKPIEA
jgi:uncharacterized membrane protein